jgi:hypothetical protein
MTIYALGVAGTGLAILATAPLAGHPMIRRKWAGPGFILGMVMVGASLGGVLPL